jgi:predicted Zn-dependent protease with MMP-like domain
MDRESFERMVARAVEQLPNEFLIRLRNIDIVVEDYAGPDQTTRAGLGRDRTLLGLYEGIPQTRRGQHYGLVPPDKITVFQHAIEAQCRHEDQIAPLITAVVKHEIAHHFGISDARLRQIEES